jgi:hypothetical protein
MMSTFPNMEYSLLEVLPDELVYEINLMALDLESDKRKTLMRSVRSKGIEKIMIAANIQVGRSRILMNTNGTINDLFNQVVHEQWGWHRGIGHVFEIPMGPLLKLRHYFSLNGYPM